MHKRASIRIALAFCASFAAFSALAGPAEEFNAAYAKAESAEKQAVQMKTSWLTTVTALKSAKQAAEQGQFDAALALAKQAEALANASIAQAKEQHEHWREAVIQ